MTVRIGQLTDIHVADFADLRWTDFFGKRATGWFNYKSKREQEYEPHILESAVHRLVREEPDVVVVSGDLSNLGLPSEWRAALRILEPLREAGIRTVVIPGNHDYYVPSSAGGAFESVCREWQRADVREGDAYPYVVRARDVAILCFNSALPTPPIMAWGAVDDAQIERARRLARAETVAGRTVVFAVHHHPTRAPNHTREWHRGFRNVVAFRKLAAEVGATLVMHGHNHFEHRRRLREAPAVAVCGLSSAITTRELPPERMAQVGMYEVAAGALQRAGVASWDSRQVLFGEWAWHEAGDIPIESELEALQEQPQFGA